MLAAGTQSKPEAEGIRARIEEGHKREKAGQFAAALESFEWAARRAHELDQRELESRALLSLAICHAHLFQYRQAVESAERARQIALSVSNYATASRATADLATIYSQVGDFSLAEREAARAVSLIAHTHDQDVLARVLSIRAQILGEEYGAAPSTISLYEQAAQAAHAASDGLLETAVYDDLGILLLLSGKTGLAEKALHTAHSLCLRTHNTDYLPNIQEHLAELNLAQKNYPAALRLIDAAFASHSPLFQINPQYYPIHVRAQILLGLGRRDAALNEFRHAVEEADRWREGALPGDITATRTVVLLHAVYQDFAELAATLSIERHDPRLSGEAFAALARNRAASLREQLIANFSRSHHLPERYFELLAALQQAQARVTLESGSSQDRARLNEIRIELDQLENDIGLASADLGADPENYSHRNSLRDIQGKLSGSEALLSFCLGRSHSFLWTVTGEKVSLHELPPAGELENHVRAFTAAIESGKDTSALGTLLARELFDFDRADTGIWHKPEWLITADGALLDGFPFPALPSPRSSAKGAWLITAHSIRLLPSELLLLMRRQQANADYFVGVADPIYNLADPRLQTVGNRLSHSTSLALARLVGSRREINTAANLSGSSHVRLLTGEEATGAELRRALALPPKVLHFAVHVVSPPDHPEQAALVLSLTQNHVHELLTPEIVASYRVPGTLVIMSGCASEQGERLPSAGMVGLARSWLLAGASGVIVSSWPTPDDSGRFFASFYRQLRDRRAKACPLIECAADALAKAQQDMQSSAGYRSLPTFWAAYSLISKE